jgi:hypothetical protein
MGRATAYHAKIDFRHKQPLALATVKLVYSLEQGMFTVTYY